MILWTTMDAEEVFKGFYDDRTYLETSYQGVQMLVEPIEHGRARIVRLLSPNALDFLRPELSPGATIPYFAQDQAVH